LVDCSFSFPDDLGPGCAMGYNRSMSYVDLHAHLDDQAFNADRHEIIEEFFERGWQALISVADSYQEDSLALTSALLVRHPRLAVIVGAHPHGASNYSHSVEKAMLDFAARERPLACGEIGLDFHYNFSPPQQQRQVFARQLALARELGLPVVIHARNSEGEVLACLEQEKFPNPVVFHCFSGGLKEAREIAARGYGLSFSGIVTFAKATALREALAAMPKENVFTETDAPYLAPVPWRGRRNTPLMVDKVAEAVASCLKLSVSELNLQMAANLKRFFPGWKG